MLRLIYYSVFCLHEVWWIFWQLISFPQPSSYTTINYILLLHGCCRKLIKEYLKTTNRRCCLKYINNNSPANLKQSQRKKPTANERGKTRRKRRGRRNELISKRSWFINKAGGCFLLFRMLFAVQIIFNEILSLWTSFQLCCFLNL